MNKLRIERNGIYEIEVNDNGDTIQFDLEDIELPFKLQEAYDGVKAAQDKLKAQLVIIQKHEDRPIKNKTMSQNDFDTLKAWKTAFREMRVSMDKFLGENGCQKIFGDTNYLEMYDDLYEQLSEPGEDGKSHLEKMQMTNQSIKERVENKYKKFKETNPEVI